MSRENMTSTFQLLKSLPRVLRNKQYLKHIVWEEGTIKSDDKTFFIIFLNPKFLKNNVFFIFYFFKEKCEEREANLKKMHFFFPF